jgi:hypothetical protein
LPWKGLDRSVLTVPGCSRIHVTGCFLRENSTATHLVNWLSAHLEALYECQPPSLLSPTELTRALRFATTTGHGLRSASPAPSVKRMV